MSPSADHPGVVEREGPTGLRAELIGGPDVREVVQAVVSARSTERTFNDAQITALVALNSGLSESRIDTAITYWSAHPDEIDAWIAHNEAMGW